MAKGDSRGRSGYDIALKQARQEFESLIVEAKAVEARAAEIRDRIVHLRTTITALSALCDAPNPEDEMFALGITEACWTVMSHATSSLTTSEVETKIAELGFDLSSQKNAKASVQAILNRFAVNGRVRKSLRSGPSGDGKIVWIGPAV